MSSRARPSVRRLAGPVVAALGAACLTLLVAAGCGLPVNTLEDGLRQSDPVTEVHITGGSGNVTVIGDDTVGVDVRRTVRYAGAAPGQTMSVSGTTLNLTTDCGNRCSVTYEVHVARGVNVTGENDSGTITASGVSSVKVTVQSGNIRVTGATGGLALRTTSGNVDVSDAAGPLDAKVNSGNIRATDVRGDTIGLETNSGTIEATLPGTGNLTARAGSGNIHVRVPDRCCRVTTSVGSGHSDVHVALDPSSRYLLDLRTGSGNIVVDSA